MINKKDANKLSKRLLDELINLNERSLYPDEIIGKRVKLQKNIIKTLFKN